MARGRDIKVVSHDGNLINIQGNVRQRTILPSSFIGSRRDLTQRYEDDMAIIAHEVNLIFSLQ